MKRGKRKHKQPKEKSVYSAVVYQRVRTGKGYKYRRVNGKPFRRDTESRFYIKHNRTGAMHLVAEGKFHHVPYTKGEVDKFVFSKYGRDFSVPKKVKAKGNWKPIEIVHKDFINEAKKLRKSKKALRQAVFFPMKNFFNPKWKVFADKPLSGSLRVKTFYAMALTYFVYASRSFVSKHSVLVQMNPTKLRNVYDKYHDRIEGLVLTELAGQHPKAETIEVVSINGIVPIF